MTYDDFSSFLISLGKRRDLTDTALVIHFRITTHSNTNPHNCHSFPVSNKLKYSKRTSFLDFKKGFTNMNSKTYYCARVSASKQILDRRILSIHILRKEGIEATKSKDIHLGRPPLKKPENWDIIIAEYTAKTHQ